MNSNSRARDSHATPPTSAVRASHVAAVFVGGVAGTLLRGAVGWWLPSLTALFVVNSVGSFALGALVGWLSRRPDEQSWRLVRLFAGTGLLGSFTTYSALAAVPLANSVGTSFGFVAVSVCSGVAAAACGWWVGTR